jgi:hypothetical protein
MIILVKANVDGRECVRSIEQMVVVDKDFVRKISYFLFTSLVSWFVLCSCLDGFRPF